jgi:Ni/Fe-hydrogenase subunit HybB-like protein
VLWLELSPAMLERWRTSEVAGLRKFAVAASPIVDRAMPYLIAFGMVLPTMHQSSLGSLMLLAGAKLHVLWRTPMLPLLFLISAVAMGYAAVTIEGSIASRVFKRPAETPMLRRLALPVSIVLMLYVVLRTIDIISRGLVPTVLTLDGHALLFLLEMALFALPALALLGWRREATASFLSFLAGLVILGGALYRFSTYLIAFDPGPEWSYFPALPEIAVTVGLVAAEVMGYLILVKKFPILRGAPAGVSHGTVAKARQLRSC